MNIKYLLLLPLFLCSGMLKAQKIQNLALTPPMGWNSWNHFACDVSEELIKEVADAMVNSGMKDAGYEYVVIDDCWQIDRDEKGNIIEDPERFPSGMKSLIEYVHAKGLKFGIYSDAGKQTCQERPGSHDFEEIDAKTYAEWGVDYLKYDWCHTKGQDAKASYIAMRDALFSAGRPIVFSICEWGNHEPWKWGAEVGHLWRTTWDIGPSFAGRGIWPRSVLQILDKEENLRKYAGPGAWNDPDMLEVGNHGLSLNQSRAHFSMWCMLAAPLIAGNDIRSMSAETKEILNNVEVIAIDQDPLGIQAFKWKDFGKLEVWFKPLSEGEFAICILNRGRSARNIELNLQGTIQDPDFDQKSYTISAGFELKDLWKGISLEGGSSNPLKSTIPGHDVLMLRLVPPSR